MKTLIAAIALLVSVNVSAAPTTPVTKDVVLNLSEVFVPGSFSSANDASIVVSGMFPNSCYSWKYALVNNPTPNAHEVKAIAEVAQAMCLMVMIPYQKEVNLGRLPAGQHSLKIINGDGTSFERTFIVD